MGRGHYGNYYKGYMNKSKGEGGGGGGRWDWLWWGGGIGRKGIQQTKSVGEVVEKREP